MGSGMKRVGDHLPRVAGPEAWGNTCSGLYSVGWRLSSSCRRLAVLVEVDRLDEMEMEETAAMVAGQTTTHHLPPTLLIRRHRNREPQDLPTHHRFPRRVSRHRHLGSQVEGVRAGALDSGVGH